MPITYHTGDLLASDCDTIAHGCNCFNTMGGGIARSIKEQYPEAYAADCKTVKGAADKLGSYTVASGKDGRKIYNLYIQYQYGTKRMHLDYWALAKALTRMRNIVPTTSKIGLPRIGCGLAGGNWVMVENIINGVFKDRMVHVYTL